GLEAQAVDGKLNHHIHGIGLVLWEWDLPPWNLHSCSELWSLRCCLTVLVTRARQLSGMTFKARGTKSSKEASRITALMSG
ncbi:hypothetical protein, partial [Klebsiella pneumoniae]|uniref:hypothetical protein n=1 Tax=Klebsiella pneumoniae TaxID=573 RepID=UPI003B98786E